MPPFSRLQLAAALLEYDNDPDDPSKPLRSAQDSAIFAHLRGRAAPRDEIMRSNEPQPRRSLDYLGVKMPVDEESTSRGETAMRPPSRQSFDQLRRPPSRHSIDLLNRPPSRQSIDLLQRPQSIQSIEALQRPLFQGDDDEFEDDEELPTVDLSSWGLDHLIVKEGKKPELPSTTRSRPGSMSFPHSQDAILPALPPTWTGPPPNRRPPGVRSMSMGNMMEADLARADSRGSKRSNPTRRRSLGGALDFAQVTQEPVQFERRRSISGIPFPSVVASERTPESNPFKLPLPPSARISRFDPKVVADARRMSLASMISNAMAPSTSDFFRAGSPAPDSVLDSQMGARDRTYSSATMGSRLPPLENENIIPDTAIGRQRKLISKIDLLRPKVLVMPGPLQSNAPPPQKPVREGFEVSVDGQKPLPPGARTGRPISVGLSTTLSSIPTASDPYVSNPRLSMSLSQLTFRNTLLVGGERDAAYLDKEPLRAVQDGEQIPMEYSEEELREFQKPVGKLYGKSLMDDLEARKAQMRGKQRVFRGDDRPSMMQRGQGQTSTLIDPATLQRGVDEFGGLSAEPRPPPNKRTSSATLLDLNQNGSGSRIPKSRSVFGVDKVWERELAKLEKLQEAEKEEEERQRLEEEKKASKKTKGKGKVAAAPSSPLALPDPEAMPRVSEEPPIIPAVKSIHVKPPPPESGSDSDGSIPHPKAVRRSVDTLGKDGWYASSDEDEDGHTKQAKPQQKPVVTPDSDSDDVPLAAQLGNLSRRPRLRNSDSDSDQPLAAVLDKKRALPPSSNTGPSFQKENQGQDDDYDDDEDEDEDDNQPLALRHPSGKAISKNHGSDEDEQPLGLRFAQQQQIEQQKMLQQQQMMFQQQLMLQTQAQIRNSMAFGQGPMFGQTFPPFGHPMTTLANPMMPPVPPAFSPQSAHDAAKFGRVDRWRRDVRAVDGPDN